MEKGESHLLLPVCHISYSVLSSGWTETSKTEAKKSFLFDSLCRQIVTITVKLTNTFLALLWVLLFFSTGRRWMRSLPGLGFRIWDLQLSVHAGSFLTQKQVPFSVLFISHGMAETCNCPRKEACQNKVLRPLLSGPWLFL